MLQIRKGEEKSKERGLNMGKTQVLQVEGVSVHPLLVSSQLPEFT